MHERQKPRRNELITERIQNKEHLNSSTKWTKHGEGSHPQVRVLRHRVIHRWVTVTQEAWRYPPGYILTSIPLGRAVSSRSNSNTLTQTMSTHITWKDHAHVNMEVSTLPCWNKFIKRSQYRQCEQHQHGHWVAQVSLPWRCLPTHFCEEADKNITIIPCTLTETLQYFSQSYPERCACCELSDILFALSPCSAWPSTTLHQLQSHKTHSVFNPKPDINTMIVKHSQFSLLER